MIDFKQLTQDVIDGNESPFRAFGELSAFMEEVKESLEIVKEAAVAEAEKEDKQFFADGFYFEKRNGRRMYDFKHIPEWTAEKEKLSSIEKRYKALLDAYDKFDGVQMATQDGEEIILPKVTYGKDILIIKKK